MHRVAGLNPATSHVVREWDRSRHFSFEIRAELLALFREHRDQRLADKQPLPVENRVRHMELVEN